MNVNYSAASGFSKHNMDDESKKEDSRNLLPTDDQLDRFVDSLCENLPTLHLETSPVGFKCIESLIASENYGTDNNSNLAKTAVLQPSQSSVSSERNLNDNVGFNDSLVPHHSADPSKFVTVRRSMPNSNLNVAILQCSRSLELLMERRKNLELLIRRRHNLTIPSYNVYTARLPDAPTRVDRLLFDINQERCRIVGLMTELEKTINSYTSKTAKDDLRKLLVVYGNAIVDVIKERQNEINSHNGCSVTESGVHRLVELVDEVHRMNRHVHTALWCLEVKEQFNVAMSRRRLGEAASQPLLDREAGATAESAMLRKSWRPPKTMAYGSQQSPKSPRVPRSSPNTASGSRPGVCPVRSASQPQTNPFQALSPPMRPKKSTAFQLFAQEQRAEIFQRFSSSLKDS